MFGGKALGISSPRRDARFTLRSFYIVIEDGPVDGRFHRKNGDSPQLCGCLPQGIPRCEPWCWNICLDIHPKNDPVLQVNIPYMEHLRCLMDWCESFNQTPGLPSIFLLIMSVFPLPSGNLTELQEIAIYSGFFHWKWWFCIAMFNYQRVVS